MINEAYGFDDVLLVPKKFPLNSRSEIDISSNLTNDLRLEVPIISANMMNVTERRMAVEIARHGGIGLIHRFMTIKDEVNEVMAVKRAENLLIEKPYSIQKKNTVGEARKLMNKLKVGGLLVKESNKLIGIITRRDLIFSEDTDSVLNTMTPKNELITASPSSSLTQLKDIFKKYKIEKIPLIDEDGHIKGLVVIKDLISSQNHPHATKDNKGQLRVGASVGVKDHIKRTRALVEAGVDVICVDVAHGHTEKSLNAIRELRSEFGDKLRLIAGNVATEEGTLDLIDAGADCVKIGIGSGSICTTRIVAGSGVPQITAVMNAAKAARREDIPIISDGGIKSSGEVIKALAAGANTVMVGGLFAGTRESPGTTIMRSGKKYKAYSGMASVGSNLNKKLREGTELESDFTEFAAEGVEAMVPYRGDLKEILIQLLGGFRSGMSYSGSTSIRELWDKAEFIKVVGIKEGLLKDLKMT